MPLAKNGHGTNRWGYSSPREWVSNLRPGGRDVMWRLAARGLSRWPRSPLPRPSFVSALLPAFSLAGARESQGPFGPKVCGGARALASVPDGTTVVYMPALSPTMEKGNIAVWHVGVGDFVVAGDVLGDIETDKATLALESTEDGVVAAVILAAGSKDVVVNTPVMVLAEGEDGVQVAQRYAETLRAGVTGSASPPAQAVAHVPNIEQRGQGLSHEHGPSSTLKGRSWPSVRILLDSQNLDPGSIVATGPHGAILKGDVLLAMANGTAKPFHGGGSGGGGVVGRRKVEGVVDVRTTTSSKTAAPDVANVRSVAQPLDVPHSSVRRIIAERLMLSKQTVPHSYVESEASLEAINAFRASVKASGNKPASVNDFVLGAVGRALAEVPEANARWDASRGEKELISDVDVSFAVATPGGLVTPIIRAADRKALGQISSEARSLALRGREGKLKPEEYQGGTFGVSNLGMFPVDRFTAIINPPQAGILAVGAGIAKAALDKRTGEIVPIAVMSLTLSVDARVIDDHLAALLLSSICKHISDPITMI